MKENEKDFYNKQENIKRYGEAIDQVGLWDSEKIIFHKYINKNYKILDIGCGAGRTTINLFKEGYSSITGLDVADNLIDYARNYCYENHLDINFILGDATKLEFPDNSFDAVIFSYNGMQCIPKKASRDQVLKEIHRVLKSGGVYIFTAHNRDDENRINFWKEEKIRWDNGIQDSRYEMFGDLITIDQSGKDAFVHFSSIEEMKEFIFQEDFEIVEYISRDQICDEREEVKKFSNNTIFWIIKKK